jgi:hypothetical protein
MTPLHSAAGKGLLWFHSRIDYRPDDSWTPYRLLDPETIMDLLEHGHLLTALELAQAAQEARHFAELSQQEAARRLGDGSGHACPGRERPQAEPSGFAQPHGRRGERRYGGERPLLCGQAPGHVPSRWRLLPVRSKRGCLLPKLLQRSAGKIIRAFQQKYPGQFRDGAPRCSDG